MSCAGVMYRSTKGASKQRRDLINAEIVNLRDKLPLPEPARQRLSQLQVMSLACCFIRKSNYFGKLFGAGSSICDTPFEFSQAMSGFLLICTKEGKLLYISENVTEYLGHSMVDLLTQGDSIYDIIDKRDQSQVQTQLLKQDYSQDERTFFCRMNVSRSFKRQSGFGDHKIMLVKGHFVQPQLRDHYGNQAVFMASCTPLITPDFKESSLHNNTNVFQSIHGLDMKYIETATNGEFHIGYTNEELSGKSWYEMLHPEDINDAKDKHMQLIKSSHEMGCMLTARVQSKYGNWVWLNIVMHIRQPFMGDNGDPAIVCINNVIGEAEAPLFRMQSQQFSAQVARSPEFLGTKACGSPPHTITQVEGEQLAYRPPFGGVAGGSQEEGEGHFRGEFGVTVTTAVDPQPGSSIGRSVSATVGPPRTIQSESFGSTQLSGNPQPKSLPSQQDQKQLLREGIMNRIKRKMSESSQVCKPAKVPRFHTTNSSGSDSLFNSGYNLQATAFVTRCVDMDSMVQSFDGGSSGGTSILVGSAPIYEQLSQPKNNIKISLKKEVEVFDQLQQVLSNPSMPLSPESLMSEPINSPETTHLMIDTNDTAVVPSSILTPEASPTETFEFSSVPFIKQEKDTGFPPELEELSIFSPESMTDGSVGSPDSPPVESPKIKQLPKLDLGDIENYFSSMEKTSKMKWQPVIKQEKPFIKPEQEITLNAEEMEKLVANISDVVFNMVTRSNPGPTSAVLVPNRYSPMENVVREDENIAEVPVMDMDALLESPVVEGNVALLQELQHLNRLDASPSHGDGAVQSAVFDQTL